MKNEFKIVITGATGFIGNALLKKLMEVYPNSKIIAVCRPNSCLSKLDGAEICYYDNTAENFASYKKSLDDLEKAVKGASLVFHLATYFSPKSDFETIAKITLSNKIFSKDLFDACEKTGVKGKIICASTFSALNENLETCPNTYYDESKVFVEQIAKKYKDLDISFLTLSDTFGEGDTRPKVQNLLRNAKEHFVFRSNRKQEMMMTSVKDIVMHFIEVGRKEAKAGVRFYDIFADCLYITLEDVASLVNTEVTYSFTDSAVIRPLPRAKRVFSLETGHKNQYSTREEIKKAME